MTVNLTFDIDEIDKAQEVLDKLRETKKTRKTSFSSIFCKSVRKYYFESEDEARTVLNYLEDLLETRGVVSVSELHDVVGLPSISYYSTIGWNDLHSAEITSYSMGDYCLELPFPIQFDYEQLNYLKEDKNDEK